MTFYSVWLLILLAEDSSSNTLDIKYSKQELINLLESLTGGEDSSVPDFLFFSAERLENYTDTKGPPRNRTELRRKDRPSAKNRTDAEKTLAKAQNRLARGKDVQVITRWARILDMLLFEDLDPEIQECTAIKTLGGIQPEVTPCKTPPNKPFVRRVRRKHNNRRKQQQQQQKKRREELARQKKRQEALRKKREREEMARIEPSLEELEQIKDILEENLEDENEEEEEEEGRENRFKRNLNQPQDAQPKASNLNRQRRSAIQNLDVERMRRSLSYTYSNEGECYPEGSEGSTSDTIMLCETCYKTVDFGESV